MLFGHFFIVMTNNQEKPFKRGKSYICLIVLGLSPKSAGFIALGLRGDRLFGRENTWKRPGSKAPSNFLPPVRLHVEIFYCFPLMPSNRNPSVS